MKSELVKPTHLARRAVVYIRQSTPHQVVSNQESLRLQYALRQRARELGWHDADIDVIDADLGLSAASAAKRSGFQELVGRVGLSEIGLILSIDVTRLVPPPPWTNFAPPFSRGRDLLAPNGWKRRRQERIVCHGGCGSREMVARMGFDNRILRHINRLSYIRQPLAHAVMNKTGLLNRKQTIPVLRNLSRHRRPASVRTH